MPRMIMTVFSEPASAEREAEYLDWYANIHIPDVTAIPGVLSARRFKQASVQSAFGGDVANGQRYLVVYEIDSEDPESVEQEMRARFSDGRLRPTDTMKADPSAIAVYYDEL